MPKFVVVDEGELDALFQEGGTSARTNSRRQKILEEFRQFVEEVKKINFEQHLCKNPSMMERSLVDFLNSLRVTDKATGQEIRPKDTYFEFYKSMLKCALKPITGMNFDDIALFPNLNKGFKAIKKDIKR